MGPSQLKLLSLLWGLANLLSLNSSYLWMRHPLESWPHALSILSSLALIMRPGSRQLLRITVVTVLIWFSWNLPAVPNHRTVTTLSGCVLLLASSSRSHAHRPLWTLRWLTIVVYFFAFLAKLNLSYLDDSVSCASLFLREALDLNGFGRFLHDHEATTLPATSLAGWWSALSELLLILLLIPRRARGVGVVLGILFHIFLATHYIKYFANFSASMFVLLCSWLDEGCCSRLLRDKFTFWEFAFLGGAVALCGLSWLTCTGYVSVGHFLLLRYIIWMFYACYLLAVVTSELLGSRGRPREAAGLHGGPFYSIVLFALLSGLAPYVGVKTRSGLSMYSNLRVEPNYSNHLFMPPSLDIFGLLADVAEVTAVRTEVEVDSLTLPIGTYPYIAVCSYIARMDEFDTLGNVEIEFTRNGYTTRAYRGGQLPPDCPPWILRKLLFFGPVGEGSERQCTW